MWDLPICSYIIKQKTAYEMRISDWSSDVCSSDLKAPRNQRPDRKAEIARIADPRHRSRGRSDRTAQADAGIKVRGRHIHRSEEHTSELQSLMRISYAVFCLKKKKTITTNT